MTTTLSPAHTAAAACGCSTTYKAGSITAAGILGSTRCAEHAACDRTFARKPSAGDAALASLAAALTWDTFRRR